MIPDDKTPATEDPKPDTPENEQETPAEGGQADPGPDAAPDPAKAMPAPSDEAGDGKSSDPVGTTPLPGGDAPPPESDPPVDDRVAKGKGDKARAATLGQVPAPKPKPAAEEPEADPEPQETTLRTRAFPGPLLAFGGRARRAGWAPGYELTAENAADRTGRNMKLMTSGSRSGPIEWKPLHLADELIADDWEITVPNDQLALFQALMNGEADPA